MPGYGQHEVIIETLSTIETSLMSMAEVGMIIETYYQRYVNLMQAHENMMTLIFRNRGTQASLPTLTPKSS